MKLYTYPGNKNGWKALIAAEYVGEKIEVPPFKMGADNKTPEFLKKNPHGKVPVLETPHGSIFESNAIARHVARLKDSGLMGETAFETAKIEQWIDFFTGEVDAPLLSWVLPLLHVWPYDKKKEEAAIDAVKKALKVVDDLLLTQTYLVGDRVTLADIVAVCNLYLGYSKVFDPAFRSSFPYVTRYFLTLANQPEFKKVIGDVKLPEAAMKYAAPAKDAKKESAPAAPAPAPAAKKEPEPKKEAAPAKKEAEEEVPGAAEDKDAKAKVQAWLDSLPATNMQLDGWKRLYSNAPSNRFREVAVGGLWNGAPVPNSPNEEVFPGYDANAYSWWFCTYKYPEENTVNFMVMNKVGGFIQRVDYARKYAFGVMCILKKDNTFPVVGCWMFRGQDLPPQMLEECYDMDLYEWVKVDLSDAAQKKRLEDMLCEEATIDGLEHVECKVFK